MSRQDNRSIETFKKDIKFGTMLEKFWIECLVESLRHNKEVSDIVLNNNGIDNSGEYVEKSTRDADYHLSFKAYRSFFSGKIEVKFAPTKGKVTFKKHDLEEYVKQNAYIYLIYNNGEETLKKPQDYDFEMHIEKILLNIENVKWAILEPKKIAKLIKNVEPEKIKYMGGKMGYILTPAEVESIFEIKWNKYEF